MEDKSLESRLREEPGLYDALTEMFRHQDEVGRQYDAILSAASAKRRAEAEERRVRASACEMLERLRLQQENWDGEGSAAADPHSIDTAKAFVDFLRAPKIEVALGCDGYPMLFLGELEITIHGECGSATRNGAAMEAEIKMLRGYVEALLAHTDGLHLPAATNIVRLNARQALDGTPQ